MHVGAGNLLDFARHGGREEQHLALLGHLGEDGVDTVEESHVEHLVGLVHDDGRNVVEPHGFPLEQVEQAARRGHDDVYPLLQGAYLALDARAAVNGQDGESVDVLRVVGEVAGNLQAEFAGGRENQCLRLAQRAVDALYHGQAEGSRLTRTGLGQSHQVGLSVQEVGDYLLLYGHGVFVSQFGNRFQYLVADTQFLKCFHLYSCQFFCFIAGAQGLSSSSNGAKGRGCAEIFRTPRVWFSPAKVRKKRNIPRRGYTHFDVVLYRGRYCVACRADLCDGDRRYRPANQCNRYCFNCFRFSGVTPSSSSR